MPIRYLPGPGTSKELLVVWDERVGLEPFPIPHCTPKATHPGKGHDDGDNTGVTLMSKESCSELGSRPSVLLEENQAATRNV